jgi:uncharacterized protein (DUF2267 family)
VRATLSVFTERLPHGEREQFLQHLPHDVRQLAAPPRGTGLPVQPRTVAELTAAAVATSPEILPVPGAPATRAVTAIVCELRRAVPEEAGDIAAVLPDDLRRMWDGPQSA